MVLLDVGQSMHAHLPFAKRAVLDFLHQKARRCHTLYA